MPEAQGNEVLCRSLEGWRLEWQPSLHKADPCENPALQGLGELSWVGNT